MVVGVVVLVVDVVEVGVVVVVVDGVDVEVGVVVDVVELVVVVGFVVEVGVVVDVVEPVVVGFVVDVEAVVLVLVLVLVLVVVVGGGGAGVEGPEMTGLACDVATLVPFLLLAALVTRIVDPTSAAIRLYVWLVCSAIGEHAAPLELHRSHWYA